MSTRGHGLLQKIDHTPNFKFCLKFWLYLFGPLKILKNFRAPKKNKPHLSSPVTSWSQDSTPSKARDPPSQ